MLQRKFFPFVFIWLLITYFVNAYAEPTQWKTLQPGIEYAELKPFKGPFNGAIHVFKVNVNQYDLDVISAKSLGKNLLTAEVAAQASQAFIAVNGGFFDHSFVPLGLRVNKQGISHATKPISWWNIFYIKSGKAYITNQKNFKMNSAIQFAIQSGPRLIKNNQIVSGLRNNFDERTALGINHAGQVLILTTDNLLLSLEQLADIMVKPEKLGGLHCQEALNLDGGTSSQMYAHIGSFNLSIPGFAAVADAVVVKKRH